MRHAGDVPGGIADNKGSSAAFALEADIPTSLRKGALEALGGRLDFSGDISTSRKQWVDTPRGVNRTGHYLPSVVDFGMEHSRKPNGPNSFGPIF